MGFGFGRGCFGREGVQSCTGTFPETGGFGAPGAYAPGGRPAMESGLTTHQLSEELDQQRGSRQEVNDGA